MGVCVLIRKPAAKLSVQGGLIYFYVHRNFCVEFPFVDTGNLLTVIV